MPRLFGASSEPDRVMLFAQHGRHASLLVAYFCHQLDGWQCDERSPERLPDVLPSPPFPDARHAKDRPIAETDHVRFLAAALEHLRFIEAGHHEDAPLPAFPRVSPRVAPRELLCFRA